ncbi:MAG: hypothetical protein Q8919_11260, partial [Bacteroidota bacterium]|nr:hypothetical protein [Bacteroidota bacterium]
MTTRSIDGLNIGLMLLSCLLAFLFPFQLFLFSFAVLGPLHYFTEIPWLHGKKYFTSGKYDYLMLAALCCSIALFHYLTLDQHSQRAGLIEIMSSLAFVAFFGALAMTTMKKTWHKIAALLVIGASSVLLSRLDFFGMVFANLIPTIVHVYIFTGCFILYGALRHKSTTGILSLVVFVICTILIFSITPDPQMDRSLSYYVKSSYQYFAGLNLDLMNVLGLQKVSFNTQGLAEILFSSNTGIIVMRLIAFSYTYHFLNWFSKTSIIKWHLIPKKSLAIVFILWIASLGLYYYDYFIGLQVLYFLSLLHVVLEYPLDHRTMIGIGQELKTIVA